MKLRQRPEDFMVEELSRLEPSREGPYGLYRLRKRGITTPEAVRRLARAGGIDPGRVSYSGLKDRHAVAVQFVTIFGKAVGELRGPGFALSPLGRAARAAGPSEIERNLFRVTIRDLSREEADRAKERAASCAGTGVPNYFDEQRFGSARATGEFPGEAAARGDYETALRLVIGASSREDPSDVKRRRRLVSEMWGDWRGLKARLDRSTERSTVRYLADHPDDFGGAFDRLPESLLQITLSAFQSLVWNEVLSGVVRARCARTWTRRGRYGEIAFLEPGEGGSDALRGLVIPFPHRSVRMASLEESSPDAARALEGALARRGLALESFRLRGLKKGHFWRGERAALAEVAGLSAAGPVPDELNEGRFALTLEFSLPPGAYATILVKAALGPRGGQ